MASDTVRIGDEARESLPDTVNLPAPTAWPIILAFGITLLFASLVTSSSVGVLGAVLACSGCLGWFHDVLPHEKDETVPVVESVMTIATTRQKVAQVEWMTQELRRARLPLEVYPFSAGIKGGLAGGVAMAVLAVSYGIFSGHGMWYAINLLAAGFFPERASTAQLSAFHGDMLLIATIVHILCSLLVGLLFSATLPMFPRRPILLGGVIAPIMWSALLHSILEVLNPVLNQRIDWVWFVFSQIGFGLVAGTVVARQARIRTWQFLPFGVRAGIEASGETHGEDQE
jgi:hypothetical protein